MSRLDDEVRSWREALEYRKWFSPRELDELEDHLRSHAAQELESSPAPARARAFEATVREELGEPAALLREFAKQETPGWRRLLVAGWGLYALSFLLPGFGIVGFEPSHPDFGMSVSGYEFLRLALSNGWTLALFPTLALLATFPALGCIRRSTAGWLGRVLGAVGASALGLGASNLLRPLPIAVDGDLAVHGHLGLAYWVWSASFALVAAALWLRDREWAPARSKRSVGVASDLSAGAPIT
ncbi:hypothetical protein [Candidatus Palauibacter sp.]|uniref:hypothetical protein n=1 Tax=Candidatus Palauibacter sp. TaxID=3101350 RepID=UPI003AF1E3C1